MFCCECYGTTVRLQCIALLRLRLDAIDIQHYSSAALMCISADPLGYYCLLFRVIARIFPHLGFESLATTRCYHRIFNIQAAHSPGQEIGACDPGRVCRRNTVVWYVELGVPSQGTVYLPSLPHFLAALMGISRVAASVSYTNSDIQNRAGGVGPRCRVESQELGYISRTNNIGRRILP